MSENWGKLRKHQRVIFSPKDEITAQFSSNTTKQLFEGKILDLSVGGVSCIINRKEEISIAKGDRLVIHSIQGKAINPIELAAGIEVKWILDHPSFNYVGFGCQFIDLPESVQQQVSEIVRNEIDRNIRRKQTADSLEYLKTELSQKRG